MKLLQFVLRRLGYGIKSAQFCAAPLLMDHTPFRPRSAQCAVAPTLLPLTEQAHEHEGD